MSIYHYKVKDIYGKDVSLESYKGKVLLIVNTASKCGFTPQFKDLEALYKEFGNNEFEILGFPCNQFANQDPGSNQEIIEFCTLNYKISFPMFSKVDVNGRKADPLFEFLKKQKGGRLGKSIKWNFTKFLVNQDGKVIERYAPSTNPLEIKDKIKELLNK